MTGVVLEEEDLDEVADDEVEADREEADDRDEEELEGGGQNGRAARQLSRVA